MKPSMKTLGEILYSPSQYIIPVFQRQYRWEEREWAKLWESLQEIQQPGKIGKHFMGFLVVMPGLPQPGQHTTFHIIDGQQRITTLSILLAAIRNVARDVKQRSLAEEIHEYYLVHPKKKGEEYFRLLPKVRDSRDYKVVITGKGEPAGRVGRASAYFEDKLAGAAAQGDGRLRDLFNAITQRLEFMSATLETENAYNIFKSLNSIGVPLQQSDLIRNFVFMHMVPDEHDEFDHDLWAPLEHRFSGATGTLDEELFSRFFRDFLMSNGDYIRPDETFAAFELRYEATDFSPQGLAATLDQYAVYYETINGTSKDADKSVSGALRMLNALESSTTYPLLLKLFSLRQAGTLDNQALARAITMLRDFIMRRYITGESSRGYGRLFLGGCKLKHDNTLQALNDYLLKRTWPDDRRFKEAFVLFPLYERGYSRHVLETLERASNHKEPADLSDSQIEHVMPQTLTDIWKIDLGEDWERIHADWLHRPGNLTLSGYNAPLSNASFAEKRELYEQSNVVITRELAQFARWGEEEIRLRGEKLAETAAGIWSGPRPASAAGDGAAPETSGHQSGGKRGETPRLQLEFWQQLHELVASESSVIKPRKARPESWTHFALGRREFNLTATVDRRKDRIAAMLGLVGRNAKQHYHELLSQRDQIEQAIGEPLHWWEEPNRQSSFIAVVRDNSSLRDVETWPEQQAWLLEKLELLHRIFTPLVLPMGRE